MLWGMANERKRYTIQVTGPLIFQKKSSIQKLNKTRHIKTGLKGAFQENGAIATVPEARDAQLDTSRILKGCR